MTRLVVNLPDKLYADLEPLLKEKELTFEEVVRLYMRSLVTAAKSTAALTLESELPIGKFKGETLEVVIRAEPTYINWLIGNSDKFKITPEALQLLEHMLNKESK